MLIFESLFGEISDIPQKRLVNAIVRVCTSVRHTAATWSSGELGMQPCCSPKSGVYRTKFLPVITASAAINFARPVLRNALVSSSATPNQSLTLCFSVALHSVSSLSRRWITFIARSRKPSTISKNSHRSSGGRFDLPVPQPTVASQTLRRSVCCWSGLSDSGNTSLPAGASRQNTPRFHCGRRTIQSPVCWKPKLAISGIGNRPHRLRARFPHHKGLCDKARPLLRSSPPCCKLRKKPGRRSGLSAGH